MLRKITDKNLLQGTLISSVYFTFIYLNSTIFKFDFVLIGVFQELLTIPFLLLEFLLLFVAIKFSIRDGFSLKKRSLYLLLVLLLSNGLIWSSFFIK